MTANYSQLEYTVTPCHVAYIRQGDTVMRDGVIRTVSGTDIRRCPFMGHSLFGDSYKIGTVPVQKVNIRSDSHET